MKSLVMISLVVSTVAVANEPNQKDLVKAAKAALEPFKKDFQKTLMTAMAEGDLVKAIDACHTKAPKLSKKHNKTKVTLGRTSHQLRSQDNTPEDWIKPHLKKYKNTMLGEKPNEIIVELPQGVGLLQPIYMKGMCLACHGQNISGPVQKELNKKYPKDQATNFNLNEFRGFFWAKANKL